MTPHMLEMFEAHPEYRETEKVRIDMIRRFGYYTTESNGHVSEYVPWYRKRTDEIMRWIDLSSWINGETGGYLRVCTEGRNWFETDFPNWLKEEPPVISAERRSDEHGSYIIEGLETGRVYRGHFNVINHGQITNLPDGCAIELPGYVDKNGINMPVVGDLPMACAATCAASVRVQEMAMEAAVAGDVTLLKQAMLHDPLTAAVCNPVEIWQLTDEMLVAQAKWLPQYQNEIAAAGAAGRGGAQRHAEAGPDRRRGACSRSRPSRRSQDKQAQDGLDQRQGQLGETEPVSHRLATVFREVANEWKAVACSTAQPRRVSIPETRYTSYRKGIDDYDDPSRLNRLWRIMHPHVEGWKAVSTARRSWRWPMCRPRCAQRKAQVGREVKAYTDYLDLLADPNVDAVDIALLASPAPGRDRGCGQCGQAPDDGEAALPHAGRGGGHRGGGEEGGHCDDGR